jgi:hypothetical protein
MEQADSSRSVTPLQKVYSCPMPVFYTNEKGVRFSETEKVKSFLKTWKRGEKERGMRAKVRRGGR